ncbi:recombination protein NinB [Janthinobacterium sp. GB4P2]|uniref:recombination protein NinB n=1 Tax=Janthinobacterium sp. GB4P2 TaxID=3424189 RepID=UPI003F1F1C18
MKRPFVLVTDVVRRRCAQAVLDTPLGQAVVIQDVTRNLEQNAKFHAICGDFAKQLDFAGKRRTDVQWKILLISGHAVATGQGSEMMPGIEGEWCNLRESSASMSIARMTSLIEYALAHGAQAGIVFSEPPQRGY